MSITFTPASELLVENIGEIKNAFATKYKEFQNQDNEPLEIDLTGKETFDGAGFQFLSFITTLEEFPHQIIFSNINEKLNKMLISYGLTLKT